MFKSLAIVYRLFKNSFLLVGSLYFIAIILFISVMGLKDSYKRSLQNEFATKQPHIKLSYINNNQIIDKENREIEIKNISKLSNKIDKITPFTNGNIFFTSIGFKEGGNAQYSGDIKIIGIGTQNNIYDFLDSSFVYRKPFSIVYTPLEFLYSFNTVDNLMVFNKALFNSYFPVISSVENFIFKSEDLKYKGKLASIFNDYDKQPIIYTNIKFANKLLNNHSSKIDGYYINAKDLNSIDTLLEELKDSIDKNKFTISSWLEDRKKQFMMFYLFETLSILVVSVILFLSVLFILLLLYNAIVKKSYQLSILLTIGYPLKKEIFIFLIFIMTIVSILAVGSSYIYLPKLISFLNLPFQEDMILIYFNYIFIFGAIFTLISYFLINNSYKMKAKSVF
ncbi:MAG: hypothetical protein DRG78_07355 [Epsilonproteobacteria bacterium]|nr:MAG: hypothetical protein DRG78_07355 [Campylobacterota bacterium]